MMWSQKQMADQCCELARLTKTLEPKWLRIEIVTLKLEHPSCLMTLARQAETEARLPRGIDFRNFESTARDLPEGSTFEILPPNSA